MTYLIVDKGTVSEIGTTEQYQELGWALMVSRLAYIRDLKLGKWTINDPVVCLSERKFLYTKIAKTVISYDDFLKIENPGNVYDYTYQDSSGCIIGTFEDLEELHQEYEQGKLHKYKYPNCIKAILEVDYIDNGKYNLEECKFAGILIRIRNWSATRNLDDSYYKGIIDEAKKRYDKVFVFGLGSERIWKDKDVIYISTLEDWASVMNHPNCEMVIGPGSGGTMICQICCNSNLLLIPNGGPIYQRSALYYSPSVSFSEVKIYLTYTLGDIISKMDEVIENRIK